MSSMSDSDTFDWREENEGVVALRQHAIAVYENTAGLVVLRQIGTRTSTRSSSSPRRMCLPSCRRLCEWLDWSRGRKCCSLRHMNPRPVP